MGEELKKNYNVKSRNEMKTISVVFVSDDLVGETIVTRKEHERAMRLKVKTEAEKLKEEEAETPSSSKSNKRKASEGEGNLIVKKKKLVDDFELELATLFQEDQENDDGGKEDTKKKSIGKEGTRRKSMGKGYKNKEDTGRKSTEKDDKGKEDLKKKSMGKDDINKDTGRKSIGKGDTGKENTKKKSIGKGDTGKENAKKKSIGQDDTGKVDTGKKGIGKVDTVKEDIGKKGIGKVYTVKEDIGKKGVRKDDSGKEDIGKKGVRKDDSGKEDTGKKSIDMKGVGKKNVRKKNLSKKGTGKKNFKKKDESIKDGRKVVDKEVEDENIAAADEDSRVEIQTLKSYIESMEALDKDEDETPKATPVKAEKKKSLNPYILRKRVIRDIKKIQRILESSNDENSENTSSESEFLDSSDESESEENEEQGEKKPVSGASSNINYFEAQSFKRNITSNNTLKNLKNPTLSHMELNNIVKKVEMSEEHKEAIKSLVNKSIMQFGKWDYLLKHNFNILLYGLGSKREITNKFVERFAKKNPVVLVNGYFPNVSVRDVTEKICQILQITPSRTDLIEEINRKLNEYFVEIYVVINNIDGIMLRNRKSQTLLSQYAKMEGIRMVATIDHINAPLMWDRSTYCDFNWIWYDCTTFLSYTEEVFYEGNIMLQSSGKLTLSSLRNVYNSLTKNSRSIFLLIAKRELSSGSNLSEGMSFKELYQACRKELLISSDVALRTLLKEFVDHAILKQKRNAEGEEIFVIAVGINILRQFVEDQDGC